MIDLFARPFGALLKLVFDLVSKVGGEPKNISFYAIAIIITTIIFKFILLPIGLSQSKYMKKMQKINPEMEELRKKYKDDPQTLQAKTMQLYKDNKINPASGCLPMLIQIPIIIAFFRVLRDPVKYVFKSPEVYAALNKSFFWIKNLEKPDPYMWGLPLLAALTTYLQSKIMGIQSTGNPQTDATQKTMNIFIPIMIFISARSFPAGLALYWTISNIFQIIQQFFTKRSLDKVKEESN